MAEQENTPNELGLITFDEGAKLLDIGIVAFNNLIDAKKIPFVQKTDKLRAVRKQDVIAFVENQIKPKEENTNQDKSDISKVDDEIQLTQKKQELEVLKAGFKTYDEFKLEFDKLVEDRQELDKEKILVEQKKKSLKTDTEAFSILKLDEEAKIAQEKAKNVDHLNKLKTTEESLKKKWKAEDDKRQNENKLTLIHLDELARTVYNMHPQFIGKIAKEQLAKNLEPIMKYYGVPPVFNHHNEYISLTSRLDTVNSIDITSQRGDALDIPDINELAENIKQANELIITFYKWAMNAQGCQQLVSWLYKELKLLDALLHDKTPDEIEKVANKLMEHFGAINKELVSLASKFDKSNHPNKTESSPEMVYILQVSDELEKLLGITNGE